jgi:hypothetical protein
MEWNRGWRLTRTALIQEIRGRVHALAIKVLGCERVGREYRYVELVGNSMLEKFPG